MASIFTYEPDTPRVASPWLQNDIDGDGTASTISVPSSLSLDAEGKSSPNTPTAGMRPQRLCAEPQEGPVEYKLHLLLRPRRKFRYTSTGSHVSGSKHARTLSVPSSSSGSEMLADPPVDASSTALTYQNRQHRLEQLTTQLLWRLQQSSPHHTSSATNIILPSLPEALPELQAPQRPARLLHGLEESQGALYEIGVSDDGTLVGLADDELQESLNNLRAMAACLGCTVEVLRMETVGDCEWLDVISTDSTERKLRRTGRLSVAEAFVKPHLQAEVADTALPTGSNLQAPKASLNPNTGSPLPKTEQLRVTLTGPTMSGKSSLLGTLTTSTLDNGRGKSRLSMLKHRHEITTGITSSVTQELIGYQTHEEGNMGVVNYATSNVASWIDMHLVASNNRLVFVSDSAGHPRYRRTTVRGLVGWAPHWTLLCVPADDNDVTVREGRVSTGDMQQTPGVGVGDVDLSASQLDLCLRLGLPLVVVITKLDLASRNGLRSALSKLLDALKAAGRKPAILPHASGTVSHDLQVVARSVIDQARKTTQDMQIDPVATVPIVLTSAVQGTGIATLHALLSTLPIVVREHSEDESRGPIFHIEDIYTRPAEPASIIVSGRLRFASVSVGDILMLGPFSTPDQPEDSEDSDERPSRRPSSHFPTSRSFPGALRSLHTHLSHHQQLPSQEWKAARVTSIRNLRLPVHSLHADHVGTLAIVPVDAEGTKKLPSTPATTFTRIRKGMVLSPMCPKAVRTFSAEFDRDDLESLAVGNHVVVYTASVRASAKIVSARAPDTPTTPTGDAKPWLGHSRRFSSSPRDSFAFDDLDDETTGIFHDEDELSKPIAGAITVQQLLVTFSFDSGMECILLGDRVLIMPGGGYGGTERGQKGIPGLDGFVGRIAEIGGSQIL